MAESRTPTGSAREPLIVLRGKMLSAKEATDLNEVS